MVKKVDVGVMGLARKAVVIGRDAAIRQAAGEMEDAGVSAVIAGPSPLWLVTEHDLLGALASGLGPGAPVGEVASRAPVWVSPNTSVRDAAHMMSSRRVRHLVVVDPSGEPVGLVDILDVVEALTESLSC
ncbi:MAG TPA: CBS domain-containing protein [Acidimicrobiales bacterium]|nr:CBS domain-containing protein [Acidimicrobiales bacterium]